MGTGIALVSALRAKVPVLIHDKSPEQVRKGLSLVEKLLAKDVSKGKLTSDDAKVARERITAVNDLKDLRDVDMVVEVRS
jgi:3-hydroxybutyryl-CoA dehydrogenase